MRVSDRGRPTSGFIVGCLLLLCVVWLIYIYKILVCGYVNLNFDFKHLVSPITLQRALNVATYIYKDVKDINSIQAFTFPSSLMLHLTSTTSMSAFFGMQGSVSIRGLKSIVSKRLHKSTNEVMMSV